MKWTLINVLHKFRHYDATDPRDKVFGLLGLVGDERDHGFDVDYSQPVADTYKRLVKHVVETSKKSRGSRVCLAAIPSVRPAFMGT